MWPVLSTVLHTETHEGVDEFTAGILRGPRMEFLLFSLLWQDTR